MSEIRPTLWFDGNAEEAAEFYCQTLPDSQIDRLVRSPITTPSTDKGEVILVEFTLLGRPFAGLNGGPQFQFSEAISLVVECEDQAEVDRYWEHLTADGGSASRCGWCKDRFGLSWQVTPRRLLEMLGDPDREAAERAMTAMLEMDKLDLATLERAFAGEGEGGG